MGSSPVSPTIPILVTTRSGAGRADSGSEASSQVGNPPQSSTGLNVPNPEMLLEATTEGRRKSPRLAELEKRTAIPGTALDATHAEPESRSEPRPESKQKLPVGILPALTPRDTDTSQRASIEAHPGTGASHGQPNSTQRDYPLVNGRGVPDEAEQATPVTPFNPPRLGQLLDRARALQDTPQNIIEEEEGASSDATLDPDLSPREPDHPDLLEGGMGPEWYDDAVSLTTVMAIPLSAEQWEEAKGRGVLSGVDGKIRGFDPELSFPPRWADILVVVDVALCVEEGINIFRDSQGLYTHGSTSRGILVPRYFTFALEVATGERVFPDMPPDQGGMEEDIPVTEEFNDPTSVDPGDIPRFRFQRDLPVEERLSFHRLAPPLRAGRHTPYANPVPVEENDSDLGRGEDTSPIPVMERDWAEQYAESPYWGKYWLPTQDPTADWPAGVRLNGGKMYWAGRLCVPENLCLSLVSAYHQEWGHMGVNRLVRELRLRLEFPTGFSAQKLATQVKKSCGVCQKSEPPNWKVAQKIDMTPVPPKIFFSVSIDIFSLPTVEWEGSEFDCLVLCVDRLSGWMVAKPSMKLGLTAEKAAHLMLDDGWNIFGIPSIVTSDQGPHFVGIWWKTMCQRLGVRQVFSQAHRPQANGRAEVAGKHLIMTLRKLNAEKAINWMEALPHTLRLIHDTSGPSGLSPYQIVFGRERNLGGLPWEGSEWAEEAEDFFGRMRELDREVASILDTQHTQVKDRVNRDKRDSHPFKVGQLVLLARPKQVWGNKMRTW